MTVIFVEAPALRVPEAGEMVKNAAAVDGDCADHVTGTGEGLVTKTVRVVASVLNGKAAAFIAMRAPVYRGADVVVGAGVVVVGAATDGGVAVVGVPTGETATDVATVVDAPAEGVVVGVAGRDVLDDVTVVLVDGGRGGIVDEGSGPSRV